MTATAQRAVTVLVTRRIKPGHEAAFESIMEQMMAAARDFSGHLGAQLMRPEDTPESEREAGLYHVVLAFDSSEHLKTWQDSPTRALGLAAIAPHTEGFTQVHKMTGLAHWFAPTGVGASIAQPPRWKVAVITWLGICPTVFVLFLLLGELLAPWSLLPRVMLLTALVVIIMTWLVAPQLTGLMRPWLYPHAASR